MSEQPTGTLRVVATIPADPAAAEVVRAGLADLVAATRQESGCLSYEAYESASVPGTFVTVEEWVAQADLDAHLQTPHLAEAFATLGSHLVGEVAIHPLRPLG